MRAMELPRLQDRMIIIDTLNYNWYSSYTIKGHTGVPLCLKSPILTKLPMREFGA